MRILTIILLFTISTCVGQSSIEKNTQKLIQKWELQQFEQAEKNGVIVTVTKTKYAESVSFEFKNDQTLEVIYSDSKKEKYFWKFKRDMIEITSSESENYNPEILGVFEIHFSNKISQLFLQHKNDPHHGIMLKI
jgi:hypothetical protein